MEEVDGRTVGEKLIQMRDCIEEVRRVRRDRCSNCGSDDRTKARLVVPEDVGGQYVPSNVVLLCRTCDVAMETNPSKKGKPDTRGINITMSPELYKRVQDNLSSRNGHRSVSALLRTLISQFNEDSERFSDIGMYQDKDVGVRVNVWLDPIQYDVFKSKLEQMNMTVTEAVKGLFGIYCAFREEKT